MISTTEAFKFDDEEKELSAFDFSETQIDEMEFNIRSSPTKWAYWKLKDPKGNPWSARWYQSEMIEGIMNGDRRIAARMGRRVGKCLTGSTEIIDPITGKLETIEELYKKGQANVLTMNDQFKLIHGETSHVWDNGVKEVFKVRMKSGRVIEATGNHPLYRFDGWTEVDDLRKGDKIAVPRQINVFGNKHMPDHEIKTLAYLIGDGNTTSANLRFSNQNSAVIEDFTEAIKKFRDAKVKQYEYSNSWDYHIHNADSVPKTRYKNKVRKLVEEHGLFGKSALEKEIPESIFMLPKEKIALFLSRLYATDGWASTSKEGQKNHIEIGYCSSSEKLIRGLQHLLLRFGIQSYLKEKFVKYKDGRNKTFQLTVHGSHYIKIFSEEIGIFSKEKAVEAARAKVNQARTKEEIIPFEVMSEVEKLRKEKRIAKKEMLHPNASMNDRYRTQYAPQRDKVKHWSEVLGSERLRDLAESDIFWDEIVSIESIGMQQTYDLTVPETKNFVANDIIVHNTETMVVYCLWHAFHHRNTRLLIVAPYENQVRLIFMRLMELVADSDELRDCVKITKNPFIAEFGNGAKIMGFTGGANAGAQAGASVRGQLAA